MLARLCGCQSLNVSGNVCMFLCMCAYLSKSKQNIKQNKTTWFAFDKFIPIVKQTASWNSRLPCHQFTLENMH